MKKSECTLMPASGEGREGTGERSTGNLNFYYDVPKLLLKRKKKQKTENFRENGKFSVPMNICDTLSLSVILKLLLPSNFFQNKLSLY